MTILETIEENTIINPSRYESFVDLYHLCLGENNLEGLKRIGAHAKKQIIESYNESQELSKNFELLYKSCLLALAPYDFESFLLYVEWNRDPAKKFYPPRRKQLKPIVDALQMLADDKLDLLAISLPPGVGKTTLAIFFLCWLGGREPEKPNLCGSHSADFLRGVYDECLRIMEVGGEYLYSNVFPNAPIVSTNAKGLRIDLGASKRFETLEFTSVGAGNAGKLRCENILYCDDLVSGLEEALSKERMDKLWNAYNTDLSQRKKGDCKELHIATRWSVHDVIGRLERLYEGNDRAMFVKYPAIDENGESNFDYKYGVGFTTKFYKEQQEKMDDLNWKALYMNEPIEREGLVYGENELQRFFELPDEEPDAIISVCDTKDRGKDYAVMPIAYVYGERYYIQDVLCDNSMPDVLVDRMANILQKHNVNSSRFESNSAGGRIASEVEKVLKEKGARTKITTKFTTGNKETKIIVQSDWVKDHCLFKDESLYTKGSEYGKFMNFLCSYTQTGRNKFDDCPDAMAMLADYAQSLTMKRVEIFKRTF